VVGGIFVQAASILDGVDGETARLQWRSSERGALLDDLLDRMVDAAIVAGVSLWLWDDPSRGFRTMIILMSAVAWPLIHLAVRKPFQVFEVPPSARRRPFLVVLGSRDVRLLIVAGICLVDRPWIALAAGALAYTGSVLRRVPFMLTRVGRSIARRFRPLAVLLPRALRRDAPARAASPHQVREAADRDLREERQEAEDEHRGHDRRVAPPG
jgi:phosphatidylglycerophosphate synthase